MAVLILAFFAALLIGAVALGLWRGRKTGEPEAGRDKHGTPHKWN